MTIVLVAAGVLTAREQSAVIAPPAAGPAVGPAVGPVVVGPVMGPVIEPVTVLRAWDRARSAAWAAGDVAALGRLYVRRSRAGERDRAMLRAWLRRGLRVRGMVMQVLAVELRARTERRMVLVVTDRLAAGSVPGAEALPRDGPTTRRLVFRWAGRWRLASAGQARASPVASTASMSGSSNS
ncbi:hypothetical protein ACFQ3F_14385 [Nocardioides ginsengisoli]|uniref:SnoaL-like domain-containing protein n=1 Tax=Nocardioides ginsengisoli TaxID=363868 RepID=A0ABW3W347_9ACTN